MIPKQKECPQCHTIFEGRKNQIYCSKKCKFNFFIEKRNQEYFLKKPQEEALEIRVLNLQLQIQREKQAHEEKMKLLDIELKKLETQSPKKTDTILPDKPSKELIQKAQEIISILLDAHKKSLPLEFYQDCINKMSEWIEMERLDNTSITITPEYDMITNIKEDFEDVVRRLKNKPNELFRLRFSNSTILKCQEILNGNK